MHRGINAERGFTEDGIYLNDKDGNPMAEPTKVDAVIFATGYRQQAGFVDAKVVDHAQQQVQIPGEAWSPRKACRRRRDR